MSNKEPYTGIFIHFRNIKNDGDIIATGENTIVDFVTESYSGKGTVQRHSSNKKASWFLSSWLGQLLIAIIAGLFVAWAVYYLGWQEPKL
jgi:hypothetical protein